MSVLAYLIVTAAVALAAIFLCVSGLRRKDTYRVLQALAVMMIAGILATVYGALDSM